MAAGGVMHLMDIVLLYLSILEKYNCFQLSSGFSEFSAEDPM
ncbi:hypothetical protein ABID39_001216 [Bartonella japonica]|uniref:Uncharacterized protein n=1 Tax=Bartonella japonica TaxID=357761 RepID=A0ABV2FPL1_9HYPH